MSVLDRILYLQRVYYDEYNQSATVLQIGLHFYNDLLKEMDVDDLKTLHGMRIDIISENTIKIEY